ncbi:MAG: 5'/3'-nucleotidase SurE [Acidimicrobiaceae bacterium]|nr:5'/3'-nucleotidase SurE [Acidimicrobiaceae bacterium]|tara:strand:- start:661 stop:1488 length:828 start_codon:yes stop_codon:yes gene_type:complete
MRIFVTNDDGIDSLGLHILARAMLPFGEVIVGAPDTEYSGASSSFGALHLIRPELHKANIEGIDEAWSITGPPALCVMFARLGAFGEPFDLVVSGINPGANVGRSVYHSGTIGACLTARNGGINGVAVSQAVDEGGYMGQGIEEMLKNQKWDSAAEIAAIAVEEMSTNLPKEASVLNINVPNLELSEMKGWRETKVGTDLIRQMTQVDIEPKIGHEGTFHLKLKWGERIPPSSIEDDVGAVANGYVSISWLSRLISQGPPIESSVEGRFNSVFES